MEIVVHSKKSLFQQKLYHFNKNPKLGVWCKKWPNWTFGVGQKNPTTTPSVVRNPTPTPPKKLRLPTTPTPAPQPWFQHHRCNKLTSYCSLRVGGGEAILESLCGYSIQCLFWTRMYHIVLHSDELEKMAPAADCNFARISSFLHFNVLHGQIAKVLRYAESKFAKLHFMSDEYRYFCKTGLYHCHRNERNYLILFCLELRCVCKWGTIINWNSVILWPMVVMLSVIGTAVKKFGGPCSRPTSYSRTLYWYFNIVKLFVNNNWKQLFFALIYVFRIKRTFCNNIVGLDGYFLIKNLKERKKLSKRWQKETNLNWTLKHWTSYHRCQKNLQWYAVVWFCIWKEDKLCCDRRRVRLRKDRLAQHNLRHCFRFMPL